ncbi:hypothetical protein K7472_11150 [Streptomyces sp. PTM05]|uniref:Uncharacterized protein n=1 Tax=Streptantibioticus parmotrematis TaxID=2873249 RepID=A0ABS7QUD0_9ACTN|nr:hypothetical protein [Streptantibioticus parmotrematis]MBY8885404.1 hypothetical protein [Streptantibioticus parmotrematis]
MPKGTYAKDAAEAEEDLAAYCEASGLDREWIGGDRWATTVRIACDRKYGYDEAYRTIDADQVELLTEAARTKRKSTLDGDEDGLLSLVEQAEELSKTLVPTILQQCADAYVGGRRVNLGLSKAMTSAKYAQLREDWDVAGQYATGDGVFTNFHSFPPQDKKKAGKGNVGATLAVRGVQGNLLVEIAGRTFTMHVDISD